MTVLLYAQGLSKHFDGVRAVDDVSIKIPRGEIRAIIGPNGAGKTTLVSLLSGRLPADAGTIAFEQRDITRAPVWDRVLLGIVYTFQVTSIFAKLSCYENVALAAQRRLTHGSLKWGMLGQLRANECAIRVRALAALRDVGLEDVAANQASTLPYGHQRLLEVAMSLALEPKLLILDEPTQGLAQAEIDSLCALIRQIATQRTVLLIEHNMPVVLALADTITVMDNGRTLAEGTPAQIEADVRVQRAYLGP